MSYFIPHPPTHTLSIPPLYEFRFNSNPKTMKHNPKHKMFSSSFNVVSMKQASGHKKGLNKFLFSIL